MNKVKMVCKACGLIFHKVASGSKESQQNKMEYMKNNTGIASFAHNPKGIFKGGRKPISPGLNHHKPR